MHDFLKDLAKEFLRIKSQKEMEEFLVALLTPQEVDAIPKRLQIVKMLKNGVTQRKVAERLGIGIATVTRGSKELKKNRFKNVA